MAMSIKEPRHHYIREDDIPTYGILANCSYHYSKT
jgi:hypothetical protein